jgi:hypothetical protein
MEQLFKTKEIISNIFSSNIEEIKKVSLICNTISEKLLIAAELETLKEYQEDLNINSILELFLANKAATFCGGAALTLYKKLQELNFMPIIFHYGNYNNGLTHVVVLIKLKNEFYLFDPYFNIYYEDNLYNLIENIILKKYIKIINNGETKKRVIVRNNQKRTLWHTENLTIKKYLIKYPKTEVTKLEDKIILKVDHSIEIFKKYYWSYKEKKASISKQTFLENNLDENINNLILFPKAIYYNNAYINLKNNKTISNVESIKLLIEELNYLTN